MMTFHYTTPFCSYAGVFVVMKNKTAFKFLLYYMYVLLSTLGRLRSISVVLCKILCFNALNMFAAICCAHRRS